MKKVSEFQSWPHQTHASGCDIDLPAIPSMNLGSEPGWAHAYPCLSIILQSAKVETVRQRALEGTILVHGKSVKAVFLTCVFRIFPHLSMSLNCRENEMR